MEKFSAQQIEENINWIEAKFKVSEKRGEKHFVSKTLLKNLSLRGKLLWNWLRYKSKLEAVGGKKLWWMLEELLSFHELFVDVAEVVILIEASVLI